MTRYQEVQETLKSSPQQWLVTGGAGFIGSHVIEKLLSLGQKVRVLDDLSTGKQVNLDAVSSDAGAGVELLEGDLRDPKTCELAVQGVDRIIHLAAMGSVPESIDQPLICHEINVTGTLNVFLAAKPAGVKRIVYASSSAVYGDIQASLKKEENIGNPLSPYAASKRMNEIYARTLHTCQGLGAVGLRIFNVFGPRQNSNGTYAAVIPQWVSAMKSGAPIYINGDGENSRDYCFVQDIAQAIILAATTDQQEAVGSVFNVGLGNATTLNGLFAMLKSVVEEQGGRTVPPPVHRDFRFGDTRYSCADTSRIQRVLGFSPEKTVLEGVRLTVASY